IFNAILGWQSIATLGSVISYCLYWGVLAAYLIYLGIHEKNTERKQSTQDSSTEELDSVDSQKPNPKAEVIE
ncbi:hypothetical protein GGI12_006093, partial [Dipsacomyces acuminosporus]